MAKRSPSNQPSEKKSVITKVGEAIDHVLHPEKSHDDDDQSEVDKLLEADDEGRDEEIETGFPGPDQNPPPAETKQKAAPIDSKHPKFSKFSKEGK